MVALILGLIFGVFIEHKYSPRFGYTREKWIIIWYGKPSNRNYIRLW
jgi:hypothetical protein